MRYLKHFWSCFLLFVSVYGQAESLTISYPHRDGIDEAATYPFAVLKLALDKSGQAYTLVSAQEQMTDARIRKLLASNHLSVAWFGTSKEFESLFLPVRVPITRGTLGYRLFVIHRDDQPRFDQVKSIEDLQSMTAGQGIGWSDVDILERAGFKVISTKFDNLFAMLGKKRIDYIPLGANEVFGIVKRKLARYPDMTVEQGIVLRYPFDFLFFVNKDNHELHDLLTLGLQRAVKDGSLDQLFQNHPDNRDFFELANIANRRLFEIDNPLIPEETRDVLKALYEK